MAEGRQAVGRQPEGKQPEGKQRATRVANAKPSAVTKPAANAKPAAKPAGRPTTGAVKATAHATPAKKK